MYHIIPIHLKLIQRYVNYVGRKNKEMQGKGRGRGTGNLKITGKLRNNFKAIATPIMTMVNQQSKSTTLSASSSIVALGFPPAVIT